ncbi:MAG: DNA recombination protein RmuC [Candidatus Symbiodolus clandestinus]
MDLLVFASLIMGLLLGLALHSIHGRQRYRALLLERNWTQEQLELRQAECQQQAQMLEALRIENQKLQVNVETAREYLQQQGRWQSQYEALFQEFNTLQKQQAEQKAERRALEIRLEEGKRAFSQQQQLLQDSEQRLSTQFENLAHRIFSHSHRQLDEQNRLSLEKVLVPLREQLEGFRRQIQESFGQEARERHTLVHEIHQLQQLNLRMAEDAVNLTQALKGNNKTQGNWGELVLSRVLEASGLREGHEYHSQVSLSIEPTRRAQPDVLIRLPQDKSVIIDAKLSLIAYERYFNGEQEKVREQALIEHIHSIRNHIRQLGQKDYHQLLGSGALDYVLLFIPIEQALLLALEQAPELLDEAWKRNVMLVSPGTLLIALRTIDNLWRSERQSQYAEQIAEHATTLYDKFRLFVTEMELLGRTLGKAQESYQQAMKRLSQGRGNLINQAEKFRQLGVTVKQPISQDLIRQASDERADEHCNSHQSVVQQSL